MVAVTAAEESVLTATIGGAVPRWVDVGLALIALAVLSPLLLLVAVAVAVGSRGPVLYRQVRMGRGGAPFVLLKFRTMYLDADRAGRLTLGDRDCRVTPVGRVLRRTKLDELPQLFNVVRGDMALVGPRPEVPEFRFTDLATQARVLQARPGLTDPASLRFRHEVEILAAQADPDDFYRRVLLPLKCELSAGYLDRRTTASDLGVLARTAFALFRRPATDALERTPR